jgi:hypothetical protein
MYLPAGLVPASQHPAGIALSSYGALPVQIIRSLYGVVKIARPPEGGRKGCGCVPRALWWLPPETDAIRAFWALPQAARVACALAKG